MPSNEIQLDVFVGLVVTVAFPLFFCKKASALSNEGTTDEVSYNKEMD